MTAGGLTMRRALVWGAIAVMLALAVWVAAADSFFRPLLAVAPVVVYSVVLLVRVVLEPAGARREAEVPTPHRSGDSRVPPKLAPEPSRTSPVHVDERVGAFALEGADGFDGRGEGRTAAG
jgi:hypothetical protein